MAVFQRKLRQEAVEEARREHSAEIEGLRAALKDVNPFEEPICGQPGGPSLLTLIKMVESGGGPPTHCAQCQAAFQQLVAAEPPEEVSRFIDRMLDDKIGPAKRP
jgi:hypothetical protein